MAEREFQEKMALHVLRDDMRRRYGVVAHLLSEQDRRQMRRYLAQMAVVIRRAREESTRLAIARATVAAPIITSAVLKLR